MQKQYYTRTVFTRLYALIQ